MQYLLCILFIIEATLLLFNPAVFADNVTLTKEYIYTASDIDSKVSSRAIALEQVKKLLLEELGVYVISETEIKNAQLTKDQVKTYSAGIVKSSIIDEKWDGKTYYIKANITANPQDVASSIAKLLDNKALREELEETKNKTEAALRTIERMKRELANVPVTPQQQDRYNQEIGKLTWLDYAKKGNILHISHDYQGTVDAFSESIKLNPKMPEAYLGRGSAYWKMGHYQLAIKDYDKAIELDSTNVWLAYLARAAVYADMKDFTQAINDFTKAMELNPKSPVPYFHRGAAYVTIGNYQQAIKDFNVYIESNPLYAETYYKRGLANALLGNFIQAISDYDKAIELDPTFVMAYNNRGFTYLELGMLKEAKKNIEKALELDSNDPTANASMSEYYAVINNSAEACAWLSKAIKRGYNDWDYIKTHKTFNNIRNATCYKQVILNK